MVIDKKGGHQIEISGQNLILLPEKAIFWVQQNLLILSDLHLGKASHFRKSGIPVPLKVFQKDLDCLSNLLNYYQPESILYLGDLFHSDHNVEFEKFTEWMSQYKMVKMELVRGNHDILPAIWYKDSGIKVYPIATQKGPFVFAHDPAENLPSNNYVFSGHLHPGVKLRGNGRQSLSLPCFYFGAQQALLPAFGEFTGLAMIRPSKNDLVFVIGDGKVHKV